jgi:hypothetical protein
MWTAEELDYMKTNYSTKPIDEIIENIQHPLPSLRKKARELGVKRTIWTQANVDFLKAKYANTPAEEIAEHIGVSKTCVQQKAHLLGLKAKNKRKIVFTLEQRNWMRRNYPHISNRVCAMYLDCCMDKVRDLARDLGLTKTQEFIHEARVRAGKRGADKRLAKLKAKAEVTPVPTTIKPMNITDNRGIHTLERIDWAERVMPKKRIPNEREIMAQFTDQEVMYFSMVSQFLAVMALRYTKELREELAISRLPFKAESRLLRKGIEEVERDVNSATLKGTEEWLEGTWEQFNEEASTDLFKYELTTSNVIHRQHMKEDRMGVAIALNKALMFYEAVEDNGRYITSRVSEKVGIENRYKPSIKIVCLQALVEQIGKEMDCIVTPTQEMLTGLGVLKNIYLRIIKGE